GDASCAFSSPVATVSASAATWLVPGLHRWSGPVAPFEGADCRPAALLVIETYNFPCTPYSARQGRTGAPRSLRAGDACHGSRGRENEDESRRRIRRRARHAPWHARCGGAREEGR